MSYSVPLEHLVEEEVRAAVSEAGLPPSWGMTTTMMTIGKKSARSLEGKPRPPRVVPEAIDPVIEDKKYLQCSSCGCDV